MILYLLFYINLELTYRQDLKGNIWPCPVCFSFSSNLIFAGLPDGRIKIWDTSSLKEIKTYPAHKGRVTALLPAPQENYLISAGDDGYIKIWEIDIAKEYKTLPGADWETDLALSPDGGYLVSEGVNKILNIWRRDDWSMLKTLKVNQRPNSLAFSPNGEYFAIGGIDGEITIFDVSNWQVIKVLNAHGSSVSALSFSPKNDWLASGGRDGIVKLWDIKNWSEIKSLDFSSNITDIRFHPNGKYLFIANEQAPCLFDIPRLLLSGRLLKAFGKNAIKVIRIDDWSVTSEVGLKGSPTSLSVSPDGRYLIANAGKENRCNIAFFKIEIGKEER
ncbi:MAG: WD40 repeat domain-containing protein [candidate division WOR-3 bacterium]